MRAAGLFWDAFDGNTAVVPRRSPTAFAPGDADAQHRDHAGTGRYGWGFLSQSRDESTDNLSGFAATGRLNFWISTTYPGKIEIGISTDTQDREPQEAYLQIQPATTATATRGRGARCRSR